MHIVYLPSNKRSTQMSPLPASNSTTGTEGYELRQTASSEEPGSHAIIHRTDIDVPGIVWPSPCLVGCLSQDLTGMWLTVAQHVGRTEKTALKYSTRPEIKTNRKLCEYYTKQIMVPVYVHLPF
jgi:hypothetical protein